MVLAFCVIAERIPRLPDGTQQVMQYLTSDDPAADTQTVTAACSCSRRISIDRALLAKGPIVCTLCNGDFAPA